MHKKYDIVDKIIVPPREAAAPSSSPHHLPPLTACAGARRPGAATACGCSAAHLAAGAWNSSPFMQSLSENQKTGKNIIWKII